jgi:hypothetical protein
VGRVQHRQDVRRLQSRDYQKDIEYEVNMANGRTFSFHRLCITLWHQERATYLKPWRELRLVEPALLKLPLALDYLRLSRK